MKRASNKPTPAERVLMAEKLSAPEARFVVANYYMAQDLRKRADMQMRHLGDKEPLRILNWTGDAYAEIEADVQKSLRAYAESSPVGRWMLAQVGIGPVIAAGILAHVDIEKAPTAGHIWAFAGLDRTRKWEKGQKRPWNADLKQICWHAGESFARCSGRDDCYYGKVYVGRKQYEIARNESGGNAERAKTYVVGKGATAKTKEALAAGRLPDGQLDRQARWYAVKLFLSHVHEVMHWHRYGVAPPKPFAVEHLGHAHVLPPPGFEAGRYVGEKAA